MIIEYRNKSILECDEDVIVHGVNCQGRMGAGIAGVISRKYPEVKNVYIETCKYDFEMGLAPKDLLGKICAVVYPDKKIYNAFTQEYYGRKGIKYCSYDAIYDIFTELSNIETRIAIPKIGAGLGGGNWDIIETIINDATKDKLEVIVYYI